jgi:hypothetical protein
MDVMQVVVGIGFLAIGIAWLVGVQRDRPRPLAQRRHFQQQSLVGPALAGVLWLLLAVWWLGRGLLA